MTKNLSLIFSLFFMCFCGRVVLAIGPAPYFRTNGFTNIEQYANILWGRDNDNKPGNCDVWINYRRDTNRGDKKLFEYVNPRLMEKPAFRAFSEAFYRTRSEIRNAEKDMDTYQERRKILGDFINAMFRAPVFQHFANLFAEKGHPWFPQGDFSALKQHLLDFWVNQEQQAGFDFVFMGNLRNGPVGQPDIHGGMNNWVAYHLAEDNNLIHYNNPVTGNGIRHPNTNNHHILKRYGLITDLEFFYNDYRHNKGYHIQVPVGQKIHITRHSMLLRTSPAFEFTLYTVIALLNNGHSGSNANGVHDVVENVRTNVVRIRKTATIKIDGCPINIHVNVIKKPHETYIESVYPTPAADPTNLCDMETVDGYTENLEQTCGLNPRGLPIDHLQRNVTKMLKL